jgi:LytS/YehU family sensor histidine kinase
MLLQPFCENAIWHGLMHKQGHGKLGIAISIQDGMLHCTISDNGIGREKAIALKSKSVERQKSLGLKITNNRLALLNENNRDESFYDMDDIIDEEGNIGGTKVEVRIRYKDLVDEYA